jgi:hypothetical protein
MSDTRRTLSPKTIDELADQLQSVLINEKNHKQDNFDDILNSLANLGINEKQQRDIVMKSIKKTESQLLQSQSQSAQEAISVLRALEEEAKHLSATGHMGLPTRLTRSTAKKILEISRETREKNRMREGGRKPKKTTKSKASKKTKGGADASSKQTGGMSTDPTKLAGGMGMDLSKLKGGSSGQKAGDYVSDLTSKLQSMIKVRGGRTCKSESCEQSAGKTNKN